MCPFTMFGGGLQSLHEAGDDDAIPTCNPYMKPVMMQSTDWSLPRLQHLPNEMKKLMFNVVQ